MTAVVVDLAKERRKRAQRERFTELGRMRWNAYIARQEEQERRAQASAAKR